MFFSDSDTPVSRVAFFALAASLELVIDLRPLFRKEEKSELVLLVASCY